MRNSDVIPYGTVLSNLQYITYISADIKEVTLDFALETGTILKKYAKR